MSYILSANLSEVGREDPLLFKMFAWVHISVTEKQSPFIDQLEKINSILRNWLSYSSTQKI